LISSCDEDKLHHLMKSSSIGHLEELGMSNRTSDAAAVSAARVDSPRRPAPRGLVRHGLMLAVSIGVLLALVFAVPSLGGARRELGAINPWWIAAGIGLEIASCVSFAVVFRAFFDQVPSRLARRIAWVEMGSGALLPGGGVTSYALGGVLLNRAGLDRRHIVVRSGGVFWLTTAVNAVVLVLGATLLLSHVGAGPDDFARAWLPLMIATPVTLLIACSPILMARRSHRQQPKWLEALIGGVAEAWRAARHPTWRLAGAVGYLGFDMAVLLCILRGLGYDANAGVLILGYLIGYSATLIPIPAGIGVLEGGLAGALVLYGAPPAQTAAAVLIYHAISFWIPSIGGLGAYIALISHGRTESNNKPESRPLSAPPVQELKGLATC
jgi:uncharacterized membrane protein YbhN (UPF0104 family)